MNILLDLSSRLGGRTLEANSKVAARCLVNPALLVQIVAGLEEEDSGIAGDCADVLSKVALQQPALVAPYAERLVELLFHPLKRMRWEANDALRHLTGLRPEVIGPALDWLAELMRSDENFIVRESAILVICNYAQVNPETARQACNLLLEILEEQGRRHTARVLNSLIKVSELAPELRELLGPIGQSYLNDRRDAVRKAAKTLMKAGSKAG